MSVEPRAADGFVWISLDAVQGRVRGAAHLAACDDATGVAVELADERGAPIGRLVATPEEDAPSFVRRFLRAVATGRVAGLAGAVGTGLFAAHRCGGAADLLADVIAGLG